ncbi:MAG: hypothetical protein K5682_06430 [Lachnospiraceae bacterium]|nr:hypothetical protein [Lachnospiraceae bacterium]
MRTQTLTKIGGILVMASLLTACAGKQEAPVQAETNPTVAAETTAEDVIVTETAQETVELEESELSYFEELVNDPAYNGFIKSSYKDPSNVKWEDVFYGGANLDNQQAFSEEESRDVLEGMRMGEYYCDVSKITSAEIEEFVASSTGTSYADARRPITWLYLDKYDAYYNMHGDTNYCQYDVTSGTRSGDTVILEISIDAEWGGYGNYCNDYETVLKKQADDSYQFVSNRLKWEVDSVPEQTFPITISEYTGETNFVTYPASETEGVVMRIIEDDEIMDYLYCSGYDEDPLTSVEGVTFDDYDLDGNTDILVIASNSQGSHVLVFDGYSSEAAEYDQYFMQNDGISGYVNENIKEYTLGDALNLLKDGREGDSFSSANEAYAYIARLYEMSHGSNEYDEAVYDLIDLRGDGSKALVCGVLGYGVDLYEYADGHFYTVMKNWGYGVGGNAGYSYLPGENTIYNSNADYAGALYYEYFMKVNDQHQLVTDRSFLSVNFDDANGNRSLDEGEEDSVFEVFSYYGYDKDGNEFPMTQEEYNKEVSVSEDYQPLCGSISYDELVKLLK